MTSRLTIDMAKVQAELEEARRAREEAEAAFQAANARVREARQHEEYVAGLINALSRWAADSEGDASTVEAIRRRGPLSGKTGMEAAKLYADIKAGTTQKLEAIYRDMVSLGYDGSDNSVAVAFAQLAREGHVSRPKKGYYAFPTSHVGDTAVPEPEATVEDG